MNRFFIIMILVTFSISVSAQRKSKEKLKRNPALNVKLAYTAIIPYPQYEQFYSGFKIGGEFNLYNRKVTRTRKSGKQIVTFKEHFATLNFSGSDHPFFKSNAMVSIEYLKRTIYHNSLFWDRSVSVGRSRWFNSQVVFKQNPDGSLTEISPEKQYFTFTLLTGIGYDLHAKTNLPMKVYLKGGLNISRYEFFPYINPMAELGVVYSLPSFRKKK
jgi:hypothetical protein